MKLSEKLIILANFLEDTDNELLQDAENNDQVLDVVANGLIQAASALRKTAETVIEIEPASVEEELTAGKLEEIAAIAKALDSSEDPFLIKVASVIDELLLTVSAPKNFKFNYKRAEENKIDIIKKKYKSVNEELNKLDIKTSDVLEALKKSEAFKPVEINAETLSTRHCPLHAGESLLHLNAEGDLQCPLDKKIYNYSQGFDIGNGQRVPAGSVEGQSRLPDNAGYAIFDTRNERLGIEN